MRILQINNCDTKGGAARVGYELCKGLIERGHKALYIVPKKYSDYVFVKQIEKIPKKYNRISQKIIHRLGINQLSPNNSFPFSLKKSFIQNFDIIHLHDIMGNYFNLAGLIWLSKIKPVVWSLHNMHSFTGACLYSYDCERWLKNCGQCPQFGKFPVLGLHRDASFLVMSLKRVIYHLSKIFPVATSEWISKLAKKSILKRFEITVIPNGIDTKVFYPQNKKEAKAELGIPREKTTIIFFVSSKLEDKRKGLDSIIKALPLLKSKNIFLVPLLITPGTNEIEKIFKNYPSLKPRHINQNDRLNLFYNAADILWHPSLADTLPLTILEAMACGTPVVASKVGGVQEIINDGENGFFVEPNKPEQLAQMTDVYFSDDTKRKSMSEKARRTAVSNYSLDLFLDKYENFYKKVIKR